MKERKILVSGLIILTAVVMQGCKPSLMVSPQELVFSGAETTKSFQVWNGTRLTKLNFTVESANSWISVNPSKGMSLGPNDKKSIEVTILRGNIPSSAVEGSVLVKSPQGAEKTVKVVVSQVGEGEGEGQVVEGEGQPAEGEGQPTEGEGEPIPQQDFSILGWIKDVNDNPIGYATVELLNTTYKMYSDPSGLFLFESVEDGDYVLAVSKTGFADYSVEIEVGVVKPLTLNVTLKALELAGTIYGETGGKVEDAEGNSIEIPPNSLVDEKGNPVSGEVEVYITPLDLSNPSELSAFPGGFQGVSLSKQGERVILESFALADIRIMQNGEELNLNTAKAVTAVLLLSLPDNTPLQVGEQVPLWYFDKEQGLWIETGTGEVIEDGGKKFYQANIPHLSWWNCDAPLEDKNCIRGMVKDGSGYAVAGALIRAVGVSYNGITTGYTDTSGYFCLNVKRNSTFRIEVTLPGGSFPVVVQEFNGVDFPSSCETGECIEITEPLVAEFNSCVQGYVRDSEGNPVEDAVVRSSIGTTAVTDTNGYYCLDAYVPVGESQFDITVFVLSRPPVTVTLDPGTSCSDGNCVEANIEVTYPEDGDYVGYMDVTQIRYKHGENEYSYGIAPNAIFASFSKRPLVPSELDVCRVAVIERELEEEQIEGEPGSYVPNWSGLDPGSPGSFAGSELLINMVRYADIVLGGGYRTVEPWMYSMFVPETYPWLNSPMTEFTCGWPGGLDIGEFDAFSVMPPYILVTNPPYVEGYYYNTFNYTPNEDLQIEWVPAEIPSGYEGYVRIILYVVVYEWGESNNKIHQGMIVCEVADDGQYVISSDLLQQMPPLVAGVNSYGYVSLTISRVFAKEVQIPLTKGGQGKFQVLSTNSFIMNYYAE
ncbi:MAG: carboxypeptidase regulatory-like domain-containing protein [Candidatus Hydrogenedentes bacterium]|nr:carboxypeptidase regulatory-like domain-containing protein [Candidatus Hydrogenedentota bacterium]